MNPLIGIVTVLYNSETVLEEFFETLDKQTYKNFILYVIDNKSPDGSLELSKGLSTEMEFQTVIIENDGNYGVAKGNNIGIERALKDNCDLILLSNNDVVLMQDTIETLLSGMIQQKASMAVPKIYYHDSKLIWTAGGRFIPHNGGVMHIGAMEKDNGQYNIQRKINYAPTCFMLITKQVFENVGVMDEKYFVYWDDTDFVYRALKQNETLWYIPESFLYHKESTSTGKGSEFKAYYMLRNLVYFSKKNYSKLYSSYVIIFNVFEHVFKHVFIWEFKLWKTGIRGIKDGFKME